ncbi:uncharacterized protein F54H12.2 [Trichonephila clavipes]|nr:uncharacterized protein F54H12.2 [Trichonephila clavipes]
MYQDSATFYENPEVPNSFRDVEALHRSSKGKYSKKRCKTLVILERCLHTHTLHRPVRHTNREFVSDIDRTFQVDLVDMQSLAEFNKGYKYLLTCIDLFSKFAWAVPLKDKFGKSVKSGLEIIFKERKPKVLQTDAVSYVYSNLISPQIVGDTQTPLLRIVQIKCQNGETISQYYDRPQYLPLVRHSFQTIQAELRLNSGDFVPFERGENFKEAVKTRSRESGNKLAQKAIDRVQSMVGKGQYKRKRTQTVIQDGQWKQFHPLSNVFDNAPVEFHISGSAEEYIDLSQTQLYVKAKIVKVDNTPITKDDTIGPVNLFLHSLFSQVDRSLNDRVVSNSSNTYIYPYRSYIETLLYHGYDSKTSQLTAELFYKDSDDGFKKRTEFFKESLTVDMIGSIHSDLFHQNRLLLNLVDLEIKLIRSKPEFCLQESEGFKVVLDHVSLFIRKFRVNPGVILGHAKALEKTSAKYPINRVLCKVYSIPKGSMSFIQDNIFSGQMPKKTFCRMCR